MHSIFHMICRALACCALRANRFHHSLLLKEFLRILHQSTALNAVQKRVNEILS
nr:MAG TPA: hypothetical protein [Caudoviricetes sp.]